MRRIRWFQRFMITLLIGLNGFVFMSMREFALEDNLIYTAGLITSTIIVLSLLAWLQRSRKKKSSLHPN